ncbi:MAG: SRPBCC family protein [Candidatus Dormiibacterota bacterium]
MSRNWLAPPGIARRIQLNLLWFLVPAAIGVLGAWIASPLGFDGLAVGVGTAMMAWIICRFVPMRVTTESNAVFPATPEQMFEIASDIKVGLQASGNPQRRRLVSQIGQPGQPGSRHVTEASGRVLTTTVVGSDPPRKLVTTIITDGSGMGRIDHESTFAPVAGGTLVKVRARQQMCLGAWLLRPLFKREFEALRAQGDAGLRDYLASVVANASGTASAT